MEGFGGTGGRTTCFCSASVGCDFIALTQQRGRRFAASGSVTVAYARESRSRGGDGEQQQARGDKLSHPGTALALYDLNLMDTYHQEFQPLTVQMPTSAAPKDCYSSPRLSTIGSMRRLWSKMRRAAALLIAIIAVGHVQLVYACAATWTGSQRGPCCPPVVETPESKGDCAGGGNSDRASECTAALDAISGNSVAGSSLSDDVGDDHDVEFLSPPVWPTPLVTADLIRPPLGPPSGSPSSPGTRTYLATLRLRL